MHRNERIVLHASFNDSAFSQCANAHPVYTLINLKRVEEVLLPFRQLPGYSRTLPGLLTPVTSTSDTSYAQGIWAPETKVLVGVLWRSRGGGGGFSSTKARPPGSIPDT